MYEVFRHMEPWLAAGIRDNADNNNDPTIDGVGRPRALGSGTSDRGPWEIPDRSESYTVGDYYNAPPGVKITRSGQSIFKLPVVTGKTVTVTCWCKYANGATEPQLILQGRGVTTQTDTLTAGAGTWAQLSVSFTTVETSILEVVLYSRDTTSNHVSYFSDIDITVA